MATAEVTVAEQASTDSPKISSRLLSIDVYRGLAVAGMLLVDYQGDEPSSYWGLHHPHWNGWSTADLVFPSFLFIAGVSIVFAYTSRLRRGETRGQIAWHAAKRMLLLIALGIFLNGLPDFHLSTWRMEGVIQRIAVCYFIAGLLFLWSDTRGLIIAAAVCLLGYWALLRFLPVPGIGVPGHDMPFLTPDRNLVDWLDRAVFPGRLYNSTHDPEGLLSTIPAIATAIAGVLTGQWLRSERTQQAKVVGMFLMGMASLSTGLIWSRWFPLNKNLWTSSFVLFAAGFSLMMLALLYWLIEIRQWRGAWTVAFLVFGMNPLIAFCFDMTLWIPLTYLRPHGADGVATTLQQYGFGRLTTFLSPPNASLLFAVFVTLISWTVLWLLYRKRVFVKF